MNSTKNSNSEYMYVDLSGYSFTGKSAFTDLLKEFSGFKVSDVTFEFALLRTPNGILDLEDHLVNDWSPVRSSEAIRQFKRLIKIYCGDKSTVDRLFKRGYHYDFFFKCFSQISNKYVNNLIETSYSGQWPFANDSLSDIDAICKKFLYKFGFSKIFDHEIYLSAPSKDDFYAITKSYLTELFTNCFKNNENTIVMNNSFEPFNVERSLKYFENGKAIIIDRDPRDIYLSALNYVGKDGRHGWTSTTGKTVEDFVLRFKVFRSKTKSNFRSDSRILKINFEDLVLNYDNSLETIFKFLSMSPKIHEKRLQVFDPEKSKKNVQLWKNSKLRNEINYIEKELAEYCTI